MDLLGTFSKISSVTMPASLPLQLKKSPPKSLFVIKSFKSKHTLRLKIEYSQHINLISYVFISICNHFIRKHLRGASFFDDGHIIKKASSMHR